MKTFIDILNETKKPSVKIIKEFTNEEDGVQAIVTLRPDGGIGVSLKDLDSGEMFGVTKIFKSSDKKKALDYAKGIANV